MAKEIDAEVSNFVDKAYILAQKILTSRRKVLDAIAKTLLEKEVLEQEDFYAVIGKFNLKPLAV